MRVSRVRVRQKSTSTAPTSSSVAASGPQIPPYISQIRPEDSRTDYIDDTTFPPEQRTRPSTTLMSTILRSTSRKYLLSDLYPRVLVVIDFPTFHDAYAPQVLHAGCRPREDAKDSDSEAHRARSVGIASPPRSRDAEEKRMIIHNRLWRMYQ